MDIQQVLLCLFFFDIYMGKMEEGRVVPAKPIFYKRFVDDTFLRRKKNISG